MTITKKQSTLLSDALNMLENEKIICFQDLYDYVIDRLMSDQSTKTPSSQIQLPAKRKSSVSLECPAAKKALVKAKNIYFQAEK